MRKLREVLRLHYTADLSIRQISASTKISVGSIQNILKLAKQHELDWPLSDELDDQALALKLFPQSDAKPSSKLEQPVWPDVHRELKKKGMTKQVVRYSRYRRDRFENSCKEQELHMVANSKP